MADRLFEDFPPLTTEDWLAQVQKDLKGAPMSRLQWEHESGIALGAIYGPNPDRAAAGFPGLGDYRRGAHPIARRAQGWELCQDIQLSTPEALLERLQAIRDWPDAIRLVLPDAQQWALAGQPEDSLLPEPSAWAKAEDFQAALRLIASQGVKLRLQAGQLFLTRAALLLGAAPEANAAWIDLGVGPLHAVGAQPLPASYLDRLLSDARAAFAYAQAHLPHARPLTISLEPLAMQGANLAQQMAFALAMAVDYAADFAAHGSTPDQVFSGLNFHFPVGTDYFGEIARFRAFRVLWAAVLNAYGLEGDMDRYTRLLATGSRRQLAGLDAQTNILRATTEAMSAILGGCDSVSLPAFDERGAAANGLSLRLASNVQRILREESLLDRVIDPVGGSYYLEHLTDELATKAWAIFQDIEAKGGYRQALLSGHIATELAVSATKREAAIRKGKTTVLGINQYPPTQENLQGLSLHSVHPQQEGSPNESAHAALLMREDARFAALVAYARHQKEVASLDASLLALLGGRAHDLPAGSRDASAFERLRLRMAAFRANGADAPKALLLTFGDLPMRKARATFAMNLLGSAAIPSFENESPEDLAITFQAISVQKPALVVLCGADTDYMNQMAELLSTLQKQLPDTPVYLAGRPEGWEAWKEIGLRDAIFAGMDRWAFLNNLLDITIGKEASHAS